MINYLIVFYIIVFSLEIIGRFLNKFLKLDSITNSLFGFIVFLATSTCFSCFNYLFSLDNQYFLFVILGILTIICFLYFLFNIYQEVKMRKHNSVLVLVKVLILGFFIILFSYQLNSSIPHQLGVLESGNNWLSLINNNYYSKYWVNLSLETGTVDTLFNVESNLGFYYLINYFLKLGNCFVSIVSPIEFTLFSISPLILYLIFDLFFKYLLEGIRNHKANLIFISFAFITLVFNFNALYYGFVGYLYNPLIIGTLLITVLNYNSNIFYKILAFLTCGLALLSTSTFSLIVFIILLIILLFTVCSFKFNTSLVKVINFCTIFIFVVCLIYLIQGKEVYLFNHFGFDYGNNYLYLNKPIIILSSFIICLTLFYNKAHLFCKLSLIVLNPIVLNILLGNYKYGFLVLDLFFNFGFIYLLINSKNENIFDFENDRALSFSTCFAVFCMLLLTNSAEDTFNLNQDVDPSKSYEYIYEVRANKYEYEIFHYLNNLTKSERERVKVVSQLPLTNAYVSNIELLNGKTHYNSVCQYCDVTELNLHEPNKLTNIFDVREYADNQLYIETPRYTEVCSLLKLEKYRYLIVRNDQYWNINGDYLSLKDVLSNCCSEVISNELYTLLKVN